MPFDETEICKIRTSEGSLFRVTHENTGRIGRGRIARLYEKAGGWEKLEEWDPDQHPGGVATISDWAEVIRNEAKEKIQVYDDSEQEMIQKNDPTSGRY